MASQLAAYSFSSFFFFFGCLVSVLVLLFFFSWFSYQIVDEKGSECPAGEEGEIVVQISPNRPVGLFTRYVVKMQIVSHK